MYSRPMRRTDSGYKTSNRNLQIQLNTDGPIKYVEVLGGDMMSQSQSFGSYLSPMSEFSDLTLVKPSSTTNFTDTLNVLDARTDSEYKNPNRNLQIQLNTDGPIKYVEVLGGDMMSQSQSFGSYLSPMSEFSDLTLIKPSSTTNFTDTLNVLDASLPDSAWTFESQQNPNRNLQIQLNTDGPIKYVEVLGGDMMSQSQSFGSYLSPMSEFSDLTLIKPSSTTNFTDTLNVLDASLPDSAWTFESQQRLLIEIKDNGEPIQSSTITVDILIEDGFHEPISDYREKTIEPNKKTGKITLYLIISLASVSLLCLLTFFILLVKCARGSRGGSSCCIRRTNSEYKNPNRNLQIQLNTDGPIKYVEVLGGDMMSQSQSFGSYLSPMSEFSDLTLIKPSSTTNFTDTLNVLDASLPDSAWTFESQQRLLIEIKDNGEPIQSSTITVDILIEDGFHEPISDYREKTIEPNKKTGKITLYLIISLASVSLLCLLTFFILLVKCARGSRGGSSCCIRRTNSEFKNPNRNLQIQLNTDGPIKYVEVLGGDMMSQSQSFGSYLSPMSEFSDLTLIKPSSTTNFTDTLNVLDASLPDSAWTFESQQRLLIEIKDNGEPIQSTTVTVDILIEDGFHEPISDYREKTLEPNKKTGKITLYLIISLASVSLFCLLTFFILLVKCARGSRSGSSCCIRRTNSEYKNPNRNLQIQLNTDGPIKYVEVLGGDMMSQSQSFGSYLSPMSEFSDLTLIKPSSTTNFTDTLNVLDASLPDSAWTFESQQRLLIEIKDNGEPIQSTTVTVDLLIEDGFHEPISDYREKTLEPNKKTGKITLYLIISLASVSLFCLLTFFILLVKCARGSRGGSSCCIRRTNSEYKNPNRNLQIQLNTDGPIKYVEVLGGDMMSHSQSFGSYLSPMSDFSDLTLVKPSSTTNFTDTLNVLDASLPDSAWTFESQQRLLIEIKDNGEPIQSSTITVDILIEDGFHEPILDYREKTIEPNKKTGKITLYLIISLASVSLLSLMTFFILLVKCARGSRGGSSCCIRRTNSEYKNPNRNLQIQLNTDGPIKYVEVLGGDMMSQSQSFGSYLSPMSEFSDLTLIKPSSTTNFTDTLNVLDASLPDSAWTFESQQRLLIEIKDNGEPIQSSTITVDIVIEDGFHEPISDYREKTIEPNKKTGKITLYLIISLASVSLLCLLTCFILLVKCARGSRGGSSCCIRRTNSEYKNPNRNLQIQLNTDGPIKYVEVLGGDMMSQSQSFGSYLSPMSEFSDLTLVKPNSTTNFTDTLNVLDASLPDSAWTFESQQDQNDHPPVLIYPAPPSDGALQFLVPSTAGIGHLVNRIAFVDGDSGHNAWLFYSFSGVDAEMFQIGAHTGELRTVRKLTEENSKSVFSFIVIVKDNGRPSLSASVVVNITLTEKSSDVSSERRSSTSKRPAGSDLTLYLIITLSFVITVSFLVIIVVAVRWLSHRGYVMCLMQKLGFKHTSCEHQHNDLHLQLNTEGPIRYMEVVGDSRDFHKHMYTHGFSTISSRSDFVFVKAPQSTLSMRLSKRLFAHSLMKQKPPNADWRFPPNQRPGPSGAGARPDEAGASAGVIAGTGPWPNPPTEAEQLQALIAAANANEATATLGPRYNPQYGPDYRQNVYIPGSTATLTANPQQQVPQQALPPPQALPPVEAPKAQTPACKKKPTKKDKKVACFPGDEIKERRGKGGGMDEWDPFILLAPEKQEENKLRAGSWSAGNVGLVADGRVGPGEGGENGRISERMREGLTTEDPPRRRGFRAAHLRTSGV
ncbi:hypothetical protein Q8A67_023788 [Cirrhinus molitorella]|uniref:Cadherin domain-containing protein n=2 Tax=Cirrhinus molitorella TaxID=172907 RepID=A0AA88P7D0_9TELE|nr:hypothetical protein Q8A67_023788 [Cirrhinus molitorella]